jgi:KaiC/GvpD/RAD55 family RecA-like ATPase
VIFKTAIERIGTEIQARRKLAGNALRFGVSYLDDATKGIFAEDLVLIGAGSGAGKSQLACNIALANMEDGKKVHYIALEAGEYEIERRLKFPLVMQRYYADPNRPRLGKIEFDSWMTGQFLDQMMAYEVDADNFFQRAYKDLFLHYKQDRFGLTEMIESIIVASEDTDLIIIDHVHYFDFDDDNENRAIREIAKTVRAMAIEEQKPIVLIAHLRKRDKFDDQLVPGIEEFHGSSDLYKIATKVVTMAPGKMTMDGKYETFFRIPKNRFNGGCTRFMGRMLFDPKKGGYDDEYKVGWAEQSKRQGFAELDRILQPVWARTSCVAGVGVPEGQPRADTNQQRAQVIKRMFGDN